MIKYFHLHFAKTVALVINLNSALSLCCRKEKSSINLSIDPLNNGAILGRNKLDDYVIRMKKVVGNYDWMRTFEDEQRVLLLGLVSFFKI